MRTTITNPYLSLVNEYLIDSPVPANLNYFYNFGSLLGLNMLIVIITGITLAFHYTNSTDLAFASVEHITRDVNMGWLIRFLHQNTVAFFFICVYIHIGRGLFYGSYKAPRTILWLVGVVIFIVMMAESWPSWYENSLASIAFIKAGTPAIKRIGPHDHEVLSRIIWGMAGCWWADRIPSKK
jgi:quinol-cytochrome oxidoreductase complex cytochrome b subunit